MHGAHSDIPERFSRQRVASRADTLSRPGPRRLRRLGWSARGLRRGARIRAPRVVGLVLPRPEPGWPRIPGRVGARATRQPPRLIPVEARAQVQAERRPLHGSTRRGGAARAGHTLERALTTAFWQGTSARADACHGPLLKPQRVPSARSTGRWPPRTIPTTALPLRLGARPGNRPHRPGSDAGRRLSRPAQLDLADMVPAGRA